jgi:hypothetical protein
VPVVGCRCRPFKCSMTSTECAWVCLCLCVALCAWGQQVQMVARGVTPGRSARGTGFQVAPGPGSVVLQGSTYVLSVPGDTPGPLFNYIHDSAADAESASTTLFARVPSPHRGTLMGYLAAFRAWVFQHHSLANVLCSMRSLAPVVGDAEQGLGAPPSVAPSRIISIRLRAGPGAGVSEMAMLEPVYAGGQAVASRPLDAVLWATAADAIRSGATRDAGGRTFLPPTSRWRTTLSFPLLFPTAEGGWGLHRRDGARTALDNAALGARSDGAMSRVPAAGDAEYGVDDNPDNENAGGSAAWVRPTSTTGTPFTHQRWLACALYQVSVLLQVGWALHAHDAALLLVGLVICGPRGLRLSPSESRCPFYSVWAGLRRSSS